MLLAEVESALLQMKWETNGLTGPLKHYTGRSSKWTVQLVTLDDGQRMGAASAGMTVMRLTEALAEEAERMAKAQLEQRVAAVKAESEAIYEKNKP